MDAQADLSLRWAHRSVCWFCDAGAKAFMLVSVLDKIELQQLHGKLRNGNPLVIYDIILAMHLVGVKVLRP